MVKHACNFSSRGQRQKDHSEFETNMVYILSCRSARAIVQAGHSWSWRHLWEELAVLLRLEERDDVGGGGPHS